MKSFGLALALALALAGASSASAHAQLESAVPPVGGSTTAPKEIRLTFSESVEPKFCHVALKNAAGAALSLGAPKLAGGDGKALVVSIKGVLAPGAYTVEWRAVSTDTHRTQGSFSFSVKP